MKSSVGCVQMDSAESSASWRKSAGVAAGSRFRRTCRSYDCISHASTKGRIARARNPCVAPRRMSIDPGRNNARTSTSGKLAPIMSVAAPSAVRFFRPASAIAAPTSVWVRLSKYDFLGALVQHALAHLRQLVHSLDDREEMVSSQLSHLGREPHAAIGEDQL